MNAHLTIQDIAGMLADSTGKDRLTTELFLREFISLVQESLQKGEVVKVKGLGVFGVEISDNVSTRTIYKKLYFKPDESFLKLVNKPFSFFDKVEVADASLFADLYCVTSHDSSNYVSSISLGEEKQIEEPEDLDEQIEIVEPEIIPEVIETESEEQIIAEEILENNMEESEVDEISTTEKQETVQPEVEEMDKNDSTDDVPVDGEPVVVVDFPQEEKKERKKHHKTHRSSHKRHLRHTRNKFLMGLLGILLVVAFLGVVILLPRYKRLCRIAEAREFYLANSADSVAAHNTKELPLTDSVKVKKTSPVTTETSTKETTEEKDKSVVEKKQATEKKPEVKTQKKDKTTAKSQVIDTVQIKSGDLLTTLAHKYYGHKLFWVYIYLYNKDSISNPNNVPLGTKIKIPSPEMFGIDNNSAVSRKKAAAIQSRILKGENINLSEFN